MSRLNPRRRKAKGRQDKAAIVAANLDAPKVRNGKVDALAPRYATSVMFANATASPPDGGVFKARFVDPMRQVKRFKRFARG